MLQDLPTSNLCGLLEDTLHAHIPYLQCLVYEACNDIGSSGTMSSRLIKIVIHESVKNYFPQNDIYTGPKFNFPVGELYSIIKIFNGIVNTNALPHIDIIISKAKHYKYLDSFETKMQLI